MATFDEAVRSQARNRPVILYTITTLSATYRFTTHAADVVYGDNTFSALTTNHDDEQLSQDTAGDELVIHLPISHPLVQRYAATGIPEQSVAVLVQELQTVASVAAQAWTGQAQSLTVNGHMAAIRVPTATNDALKIQLPTIAAQRTCNHVLFDPQCAPNPGGNWPADSGNSHGGPRSESFTLTTMFVVSLSSDGVTIGLVGDAGSFPPGFPDGWFTFGKLTFGGETRTIVNHTGGVITIDDPVIGLAVNAIVAIVAGCDHTNATCKTKFGNMTNFGGAPQMNNIVNPWTPDGLGVIQQA